MAKQEIIIVADYGNEHTFTIDELCQICHLTHAALAELIQYDIIHPHSNQPNQWQFDVEQLQRVQKALRLQHDLEVNLAGVAVLLDLLDELEMLRTRVKLLR